MHYIINPWIIYLLHLIGSIWTASLAIFLLGAGFLGIGIFFAYLNDEFNEKICQVFKTIFVVTFIAGILLIFLPTEQTMKEMLVASYVTEENIDATKENTKDLIDYIIERIEDVKDQTDDE